MLRDSSSWGCCSSLTSNPSFHMLGLTHIVLDLSGSSGLDLTTTLSLQYIVTEAKKLQVGAAFQFFFLLLFIVLHALSLLACARLPHICNNAKIAVQFSNRLIFPFSPAPLSP